MAWRCYNCGKNNDDTDLKCTNCFKNKSTIQLKKDNNSNISLKAENKLNEKASLNDNIDKEKTVEKVVEEIDYSRNLYCRNCGYKFEERVTKCPKCGTEIIDKRINIDYGYIPLIMLSVVCLIIGTILGIDNVSKIWEAMLNIGLIKSVFYGSPILYLMSMISFIIIIQAHVKYKYNKFVFIIYVLELVYIVFLIFFPYILFLMVAMICGGVAG